MDLGPFVKDNGEGGHRYLYAGPIISAIVNNVLLFGLETLVVTPCIGRLLGGLYHRVEWWIAGKKPRKWADGSWDYPPLEGAMILVGLEDTDNYISRRHNMVA